MEGQRRGRRSEGKFPLWHSVIGNDPGSVPLGAPESGQGFEATHSSQLSRFWESKKCNLLKEYGKKKPKKHQKLFLRLNNKRSRLLWKETLFFSSASSCFHYDFYASQAERNKDQPLGLGFSLVFFFYRKGRGCDSHRRLLTPSNPIVLLLFSFSLARQQNNSL